MIFSSYLLGKLNALLKVKINFFLFRFGPKTQPCCHTIVLNVLCLSFLFIELKCPGESLKINLIRNEMSLLLICIMQVNKINCFKSQINFACLKLMF